MKRYALVFLAAIFLPSLVLGWLALRTAREQRVLIERQATDLHQAETDAIAARIEALMEERQQAFARTVLELVKQHGAAALSENYGTLLAAAWPDGGLPFAIAPDGQLVWPSAAQAQSDPRIRNFLANNSAFLSNRAPAELYQSQPTPPAKTGSTWDAGVPSSSAPARENVAGKGRHEQRKRMAEPGQESQLNRAIVPQSVAATDEYLIASKVAPNLSTFRAAVAGGSQGFISRFVQDDLQVLFWTRPDPNAEWIFGVMLGPEQLDSLAAAGLPAGTAANTEIAILNEKTRPIARQPAGFDADWKRPFVATEIGEILPHWETALYLSDPGQLAQSARLISVTLVLLISLALAAILAGGYFVAMDTRRQLTLAQKKTDFVSNVSHELKTPLTSIRMFAELLAEQRVKEPEKQLHYLRIIASESERLARLVNNVLDFARLEKNRKTHDLRDLDLHPVIERVWETESLRLREAGFVTEWQSSPGPYQVHADADAIAQVVVNLFSNAEKYSTDKKEALLRTKTEHGRLIVEILDRGIGIPRPLEEKVFEAFFRADDSLSSGVQGSGLGLTLARHIIRDHGGELACRPREGGGTIFTITLPLSHV